MIPEICSTAEDYLKEMRCKHSYRSQPGACLLFCVDKTPVIIVSVVVGGLLLVVIVSIVAFVVYKFSKIHKNSQR